MLAELISRLGKLLKVLGMLGPAIPLLGIHLKENEITIPKR